MADGGSRSAPGLKSIRKLGWKDRERIGLNESGLPELATYAQHSSGEACSWSELESSIGYYGNLAPDVFVSWGVHASYTDADALPGTESTDRNSWSLHGSK